MSFTLNKRGCMNKALKLILAFAATLVGGFLTLVLGMFLWNLFLPYNFIGALILGPIYLFIVAPKLKKYMDKLYPENRL
jgi:hypothetical protein